MKDKHSWGRIILGSLISAASMAIVNEVARVAVDAVKKKWEEKKEKKT
jgi:hypothetical protein